jgi:aspartokinase/homoserine dehydrogenase 1
MASRWKVHKFGGTSLAGADRYRAAREILRAEGPGPHAVVVSAMSGVTDGLLALAREAGRTGVKAAAELAGWRELRDRHREVALALGAGALVLTRLEADFQDLEQVLRAIALARGATTELLELVAGYGELWSAQLLHAALLEQGAALGEKATWLDAREVLVVCDSETGVTVDWSETESRWRSWRDAHREEAEELLVITGFIASTATGTPTTLKRNGSDFSATIFGSLLDAQSVTIWKEVPGVLSADPRVVAEAAVLEDLSYEEAAELAYFGAKVLHPSAMAPAMHKEIPILIRSSFDPSLPGTRVHRGARSSSEITGFSTVSGVALLNVEGTGMLGVPGVAQRVFGALREISVSVIFISQASSEHSICLVVSETDAARAKAAIEKAFEAELRLGRIERIELIPGCSVLAAVGDRMVERRGVAARFFSNLARAGVNVMAIAQGSSERNISVVVRGSDTARALRAAHSGLHPTRSRVAIGLLGPGQVGRALLGLIAERKAEFEGRYGIELWLRGVCTSREMWFGPMAGAPRPGSGEGLDLERWEQQIPDSEAIHTVFIDCSASDAPVERYAAWLASGYHVVTPNKRSVSGPGATYRELKSSASSGERGRFFYSATVGAGLPVLSVIRELVAGGDRVQGFDAVLSGTLSFLLNSASSSEGSSEPRAFSAALREAMALGYVEPDPRDDLGGLDLARKAVILARELGEAIELAEVERESLVPEELARVSTAEFLTGLEALDAALAPRLRVAAESGRVLRYVATWEPRSRVRVGLREYPLSHPFARLRGTENAVAIRCERYGRSPLLLQGPGAGPVLTAGAVLGDVLRAVGATARPFDDDRGGFA